MARELIHRGIRVPRSGHIAEQVFYEHWRALVTGLNPGIYMEPHVTVLMRILGDYPWRPDQRCASVCATFITWLGCNNGASLLHAARRFAKDGIRNPMLHSWHENNRRLGFVNGGVRTIESMLAPDDHFGTGNLLGMPVGVLVRLPVLRMEDAEAVEHLCMWLWTAEGREFIRDAEMEIDRRRSSASRHAKLESLLARTG